MKALRLKEWHTPAVVEDVPVPEPGPGEVLIKMGGAGACYSDIHIMDTWGPELIPSLSHWQLPMTIGHENAGWIEGGDVSKYRHLEIGMPVAVSWIWTCGTCASCRLGASNYCEQQVLSCGGGRDGGMA